MCKSFQPKVTPPLNATSAHNLEVGFHGEQRLNLAHVSTTNPEVRLFRKGKVKEAKLCLWIMC